MRRAAPIPEQIECRRQVRALERQVKRILYQKRVPCRRYAFVCQGCEVTGRLLIEIPHVTSCPKCGSDLDWQRMA